MIVYEYNQRVRNETHLRDPFFELSCDLGHEYYLIRDVDLPLLDPSMFEAGPELSSTVAAP